jgi:hypothetical protein
MKLRHGARAPLKLLLVLGAVVVLAAALIGPGGTATSGTAHKTVPCPPNDAGRKYCVVLTTYDGTQATGGQKVVLHLENYDNNTLTNPVIKLDWTTVDLTVEWVSPKPSNCLPQSDGSGITCSIPNVPGLGSGAGTRPPNESSPKVTLYFDTVAVDQAPIGEVPDVPPTVTWLAEGSVNEGPSGTPNVSVRTASGSTAFDAQGDNDALSFALPGKPVTLGKLGSGNASLKYVVPVGTDPYETSLIADPESTDFCLGGVTCHSLELTSDVPGATGGLLIWEFIAVDPPGNLSNAKAIHIHDAVAASANRDTNKITGQNFSDVEGVHITGSGDFDGNYWIRFADSTSFQLSIEKKGPIFNIPGTGITAIQAGKLDLIDQRDADCKTLAGAVTTPSLHVEKVSNNDDDLHFWVCDSGNGNVGGGGW